MPRTFKYLQVKFSDPVVSKFHIIPAEEDRTSPWEMAARDRSRFKERIERLGALLSPAVFTRPPLGSLESVPPPSGLEPVERQTSW